MVVPTLLAAVAAVASPGPSTTIADLVEAQNIAGVAVSPDGRFVAFRTEKPSILDNRIHLTWYVEPVDGSAPAHWLADGGDAEIDGGLVPNQLPVWAPSSRAFYARVAQRGEVQVWRFPVDGSGPAQVTDDPSDVRTVALSSDGQSLTLTLGATRDTIAHATQMIRDDGILIDRTIDTSSALVDDSIVHGRPGTLRFTGNWFARQPLLWSEDDHRKQLALPAQDLVSADRAKTNAPLAIRIDEKDGDQTLYWIDAQKQDHACLSSECPHHGITSTVGMRNGRDVLVTVSDIEHAQTLWIWTPAANRWRKLVGALGMLNGGSPYDGADCSPSKDVIVCVAAEPSGPPRLVGIDFHTGHTKTLYDANQELRGRAWPTRAIRWNTPTGVEASGQLLLPIGPTPKTGFPLVIDYYDCYGFLKGGVGDEVPLAPLARAGIATLCVNKPLFGAHDFAWAMATSVAVVRSAIDTLSGEGLVDRKRVGMAGLSFGESATMTVAEHTDLLRAAAIASGDIDPIYWWAATIPGRGVAQQLKDEFEIDSPDTDAAAWKAHTAVGGLPGMHTPLLMQLPESEMRLSIELYSRLANSPTPVEMFGYPNETHIKWEPRHKLATYQRNFDWFRFWLLGDEDSDPGKAEQYRRWRAFSSRPGFGLPLDHHAAP